MTDWRDDAELLCHCHGVRAGVVRRTVRDLRARRPEQVGAACKAGTGCRSCHPDILVVIRQEADERRRRGFAGALRRLLGLGPKASDGGRAP